MDIPLPTFGEILAAIHALGVAGGPIFAALWWREYRERSACQKELQSTTKELLTQTLTAISQATAAVVSVSLAVSEVRVGMKDFYDRLAQLIQSFKK